MSTYRATTPVHTFNFSLSIADAEEVRITYAQNGIVMEKNKSDLTISEDGKTATLKLTQEETNKFKAGTHVRVQARIKLNEDTVVATRTVAIPVGDVLDDTVM